MLHWAGVTQSPPCPLTLCNTHYIENTSPPVVIAPPLLCCIFEIFWKRGLYLNSRVQLPFKQITGDNGSCCDLQPLVQRHLFMHQVEALMWHVESRFSTWGNSSLLWWLTSLPSLVRPWALAMSYVCFDSSGSDSFCKETQLFPHLQTSREFTSGATSEAESRKVVVNIEW